MTKLILLILGLAAVPLAIFSSVNTIASSNPVNMDRGGYPAHWWEAVSREGVPEWEVLPQEAGPGEVILSKRNELGILSNFAPTPFIFRGKRYASLEGFWQAMKYPESENDPRASIPEFDWEHTREEVTQLAAFEAKAAGDLGSKAMKILGIDWVSFEGSRMTYRPVAPRKEEHYQLIEDAMWAKLTQNDEVRRILLLTGDLILRPDHQTEENPPTAWRYCDIYMQFREKLGKNAKF